jgi:hypothetical protein
VPRSDFARARLRQPADRDRELEGATGPMRSRTSPDELALDRVGADVRPDLQHHEAGGDLALEAVLDPDHGAFRDRRVEASTSSIAPVESRCRRR